MSQLFTKMPGDTLDYDVDFQRWLEAGDVIVAAVAETSIGLTVTKTESANGIAKVWLADGVVNVTYRVTTTILTGQQRTKQATFDIKIVATAP